MNQNHRLHYAILTILILGLSLTCCTEKKGKDQMEGDVFRLTSESIDSLSALSLVDTIFLPNAPSKITRKIRQTKSGKLLMAAFTDVVYYDGESFFYIPKPEGFDSFDAFDALEDSNGNIWIASTRHGVFRYDGTYFVHFTTDNGLAHNRTMDLLEDRMGNIWIASMGGLCRYNGSSFDCFTTEEGLSNNDVNTIMEDKTGKIWLGTRGAACIYEPSTSSFTEVMSKDGTTFNNIWSIVEDEKGDIWLGGQTGLWCYNGRTFIQFANKSVNCIDEDNKGNIWTCSPNGMLNRYNGAVLKKEVILSEEIFETSGMLFRVTADKGGDIWVGTLKGVFRYKEKTVNYFRNSK